MAKSIFPVKRVSRKFSQSSEFVSVPRVPSKSATNVHFKDTYQSVNLSGLICDAVTPEEMTRMHMQYVGAVWKMSGGGGRNLYHQSLI